MSEQDLRTLVVEDEAATRRMLHEVLRLRGHDVEACADAETAWTIYRRVPSDLVLLDLDLPGAEAIELCRRIRQSPEEHDPLILFVSGVEGRSTLERALDAGADDYLRKPVDDEGLQVRLSIAERRIRDLRERREREAHLRRDALHDPVTGLANRTFLMQRIEHAIRRSRREDSHLYGVLLVDVQDFSLLNDRLGREAADQVLEEVGRRLEDCVRSVDTVARLEADRFAILLDAVTDVSDPSRVTTRTLQVLSSPFGDEDPVTLSACVGIALSASGYQNPDDILRDAHDALDRAKKKGPGSYRIHDPVMHAKALARLELEARIDRAVERGEMELHYQPIVGIRDGRVRGFEALLRWNDPERGLVGPDDFIPTAEGSGLITTLGSWVLDRVVEQLEDWSAAPHGDGMMFVSVNVSGKQFLDPELGSRLGALLDRAPVDGRSLHLEITETSLMDNVDTADRVLTELNKRAVRIQIDDFGTGYSSLSYLCRFPVDALKIDRSFIRRMPDSPEHLEVVRTIVRLGKNLGMMLVAEGVETERELDILRDLGCDLAQGYLFSRPVPASEASTFLRDPVIG